MLSSPYPFNDLPWLGSEPYIFSAFVHASSEDFIFFWCEFVCVFAKFAFFVNDKNFRVWECICKASTRISNICIMRYAIDVQNVVLCLCNFHISTRVFMNNNLYLFLACRYYNLNMVVVFWGGGWQVCWPEYHIRILNALNRM